MGKSDLCTQTQRSVNLGCQESSYNCRPSRGFGEQGNTIIYFKGTSDISTTKENFEDKF